MFEIEKDSAGKARLTAGHVLTIDDFAAIAARLGSDPFQARKSALIAARKCRATEAVESRWNGQETMNIAAAGDYIATSLDRDGRPLQDNEGHTNVYVISMDQFANLYQATAVHSDAGNTYRARGSVTAIFIPAGFEIKAPWGETQRADRGYLLHNGHDVYGNHADTFEASYDRITS